MTKLTDLGATEIEVLELIDNEEPDCDLSWAQHTLASLRKKGCVWSSENELLQEVYRSTRLGSKLMGEERARRRAALEARDAG